MCQRILAHHAEKSLLRIGRQSFVLNYGRFVMVDHSSFLLDI